MPYISQTDRNKYKKHLDAVLEEFSAGATEEDLGGHLNYCISYLMTSLWRDKRRYVRANTIRGAVNNALDEWYRVHIAPYEEKKKEANGDV